MSDIRWVANLSLLFSELPLLERPRAAKDAGFEEVEFWWPFGDQGRVKDEDVSAFIDSIESSELRLTAMNLFGGDMEGGDRGVLSYPERTEEFRESVSIAARVGEALGTRLFNVPYGHRRDGLDIEVQDKTADENLVYATAEMRRIDGTVLLEPLSGWPQYPLKVADDALAIIDRLRADRAVTNLSLLVDQFHLESNGVDVIELLDSNLHRIAHVQIADVPGRGEPGSGQTDFRALIERLRPERYKGAIGLEYVPTTNTAESLAKWRRWLSLGQAPERTHS